MFLPLPLYNLPRVQSDAPRKNIAKMLGAGKQLHLAAIEVTVLLENEAMGEVFQVLQAYLGMLEQEARYLGSSKVSWLEHTHRDVSCPPSPAAGLPVRCESYP
jgi:hypothetical protein